MNKPGEIKAISRKSAVLLPACLFLLGLLVSSGCIEKMELPSDLDADGVEFSAGDTTYLLLSPIWDESYGFQTPIEISIAQDGRIFVADSAANSIFVLEQDGDIASGFDDLNNIVIPKPSSGVLLGIATIDGNSADGADIIAAFDESGNCAGAAELTMYGTDAYIQLPIYGNDSTTPEDEGIDPGENFTLQIYDASEDIVYDHPDSFSGWYNNSGFPMNEYNDPYRNYDFSSELRSSRTTLGPFTFFDNTISPIDVDIDQKMNVFFIDGSQKIYCWNQYWNDVGIDSLLVGSEWQRMDVLIDSLLSPHTFFDGENPDHNFSDQWFETEESKFSGISAPGDNSDFIYVTDTFHNRIIRIDFYKTYYLKLSTGEEVWAHEGHFGETVTEYGTGAGYVNQPLSIDVNKDGDIYYSQSGDFFNLHQIQPKTEGDYSIYPFAVEWEGNDIMDTTRFFYPEDIAVDQNRMVYVANTNAQEIQIFNSHGGFFKKAGVEYITVDTTMTSQTDSSIVDTFYTKEIKGVLEKPRSVTVDSRGVIYICDTPSSSIFRYRLSNQLDENLNPIP